MNKIIINGKVFNNVDSIIIKGDGNTIINGNTEVSLGQKIEVVVTGNFSILSVEAGDVTVDGDVYSMSVGAGNVKVNGNVNSQVNVQAGNVTVGSISNAKFD